MWLRRCPTRGRADAKTKRRESNTSATNETSSAVVVTPLNINSVENVRSQVGWLTKLKSPYPVVVIVSTVK